MQTFWLLLEVSTRRLRIFVAYESSMDRAYISLIYTQFEEIFEKWSLGTSRAPDFNCRVATESKVFSRWG